MKANINGRQMIINNMQPITPQLTKWQWITHTKLERSCQCVCLCLFTPLW